MLDPNRKYYVTASQAHRVMKDFELELSGASMEKPNYNHYSEIHAWIDANNAKPSVGALKKIDVIATTAEITEIYKYVKATTPVFSDGMESVAREIAMNKFIVDRDVSFKSVDMERGNAQEGEAILKLESLIGVSFDNIEDDQSFLTKGSLGVTPDGIEFKGFNIKSCAEVKNPLDKTHMRYLSIIRDTESFLKECSNYYWQAQTGLAVTDAEVYHWASYHNGFKGDYRLVYLPIEPNLKHIELLKARSERVAKRVPEIEREIFDKYAKTNS